MNRIIKPRFDLDDLFSDALIEVVRSYNAKQTKISEKNQQIQPCPDRIVFCSSLICDQVSDGKTLIFYLWVVIFKWGTCRKYRMSRNCATNQIDCFTAHALFLSICAKCCFLE